MASEFSYENENDLLTLSLAPSSKTRFKRVKRYCYGGSCSSSGEVRPRSCLHCQQQQPTVLGSHNFEHTLFLVFDSVLAHISDYPTLYYLSLTCRTFHGIIHGHRSLLSTAFYNLERRSIVWDSISVDTDRAHGGSDSASSQTSDRVRNELSGQSGGQPRSSPYESRPCRTFEDYYFCHIALYGMPGRQHPDGMFDVDILRSPAAVPGVGPHSQLSTHQWLPCYGCMRIRHEERHFFEDDLADAHKSLLGCQALHRRCIDCRIAEPERWERPMRFVQDMPRGLSGYRQRCSACRTVEWIFKRPRGKRAARRLCTGCFECLRNEEGEKERGCERLYWKEWTSLLALLSLSGVTDHDQDTDSGGESSDRDCAIN